MGRVISVVSPKGGVGKTTVSTNLAVGLARVAPKSTVLVDLDLQFGDVASGLNLDPEYDLTVGHSGSGEPRHDGAQDLPHAARDRPLRDLCAGVAGRGRQHHRRSTSGSCCTPWRRSSATSWWTPHQGCRSTPLPPWTPAPISSCSPAWTCPGLRGMRKEVDTLRALGMLGEHPKVVINMADARSGLSVRDIEATIGLKVDVMLPGRRRRPASVNLGVPLLQSGTRDPMTAQLRRLLNTFIDPKESASLKAKAPGFDKAATSRTRSPSEHPPAGSVARRCSCHERVVQSATSPRAGRCGHASGQEPPRRDPAARCLLYQFRQHRPSRRRRPQRRMPRTPPHPLDLTPRSAI